jgi:hypothetical protein
MGNLPTLAKHRLSDQLLGFAWETMLLGSAAGFFIGGEAKR